MIISALKIPNIRNLFKKNYFRNKSDVRVKMLDNIHICIYIYVCIYDNPLIEFRFRKRAGQN